MYELRVTGGFNDTLTTDLRDKLGGLDGATVKGALALEGGSWPASNSADWKAVTVSGSGAQQLVSQLISDSTLAGHYHWWLWVTVGGLSFVLQVADPDHPKRPWLIYVR